MNVEPINFRKGLKKPLGFRYTSRMSNPCATTPADHDSDVAVAPARPALKRPSLWKVVLVNDDFTPMDFVVRILMDIFGMTRQGAAHVMMTVHEKGRGVAGIYPKEVALMKQSEVADAAFQESHPLRVDIEKSED